MNKNMIYMYILRKQNSKNLPILLKGGDIHLKVSFHKEIYDESLRLDTPVVFFSDIETNIL